MAVAGGEGRGGSFDPLVDLGRCVPVGTDTVDAATFEVVVAMATTGVGLGLVVMGFTLETLAGG